MATGKRMRLSEIGILDKPAEFDLLLELLDEALATQTKMDETTSAVLIDGSLNIVLEPSGGPRKVTLQTKEIQMAYRSKTTDNS